MSLPEHYVNEDGACHIVGLNDVEVAWASEDCPVCRAERAEARVKELEEERDEAWRALRWVWENVKEWRMSPCPNDILTIYFKAARAFERALRGEEGEK